MIIKEISIKLSITEDAVRRLIRVGIKRNGQFIKINAKKAFYQGSKKRWIVSKENFETFKRFYYEKHIKADCS